jgi:hypothetical protein
MILYHTSTARIILAMLGLLLSQACSSAPATKEPVIGVGGRAKAFAVADSAAVHGFVQGFYDWYAPIVDTNRVPGTWIVLDSGNRFLEPHLADALRGDSIANVITPPSRDVLNFDPFLDSQDPCIPYKVAAVAQAGASFHVTIRPTCGSTAQTNRPVVEVVSVNGKWKIANVSYQSGYNLRGILCEYAKADQRPDRRPATCP